METTSRTRSLRSTGVARQISSLLSPGNVKELEALCGREQFPERHVAPLRRGTGTVFAASESRATCALHRLRRVVANWQSGHRTTPDCARDTRRVGARVHTRSPGSGKRKEMLTR